jgi:hypothetical protein
VPVLVHGCVVTGEDLTEAHSMAETCVQTSQNSMKKCTVQYWTVRYILSSLYPQLDVH